MKPKFPSPRINVRGKKSHRNRVGKKNRVPGKTCHQCRQEIKIFAATCKNLRKGKSCLLRFCRKCLLNRYGEKAKEVNILNNWMCPKCRGICNCSVCMKLKNQPPTGALVRIAKAAGFTCVSEMLRKKEAEKLKLSMANNTDVGPSKEDAFGKEVLVEDNYCPTHCVAMSTEDWGGNVLFIDPSPLSSNQKINWDGTIVIGDNDNDGRLNSHMEIEQLEILDNNAIRPERKTIEEEIFFPSRPNIESVLDIEFQREDAASEMQFVDFNTLIGKTKALELPKVEEDEELCEEDEDEHEENSCGACGEQYGPDEFWIFCDICERWFHGKCVNITPVRAKHIKIYKCPSCNKNKRALP